MPAPRGKASIDLRFLFLDGTPDPQTLSPISWKDFFARFDEQQLSLAYEDGGSGQSYELKDGASNSAVRVIGNAV